MSDDIAVSFQDISKSYILFNRPQDRLKESLFKYFGKHYGREFWALRDVSYQVREGEVLGIIGRNGSGKSTLLQIIAGTLQPTSGGLFTRGRLAALLELGAGFNPEFTGRENIFLNGAILGLSNQEIGERLNRIIDFAGIGEFIDQPVKIYSSGMYIRLAFAIASSIDPDILIIDESLAVGDGAFVIKCMNRMKQLKSYGTTIILVTHDVQTVRSFCDTALWLKDGVVQMAGAPIDVTSLYIQHLFDEPETAAIQPSSSINNSRRSSKSVSTWPPEKTSFVGAAGMCGLPLAGWTMVKEKPGRHSSMVNHSGSKWISRFKQISIQTLSALAWRCATAEDWT